MNTHRIVCVLGFAVLLVAGATGRLSAAVEVGPKGGRLLETVPQKAEFFVNSDQRVEVLFYDAALKPSAPSSQTVSVIAETPTGRTALAMDKAKSGFISKEPLPAGAPYRVVVQVRAAPDAKPQNFRIDLNLGECGECSHPEYACTCEGH